MQSVGTRTRVNQMTLLLAVSFLFYQWTNWQHGIWVVISTAVVAGPFSTFLSFEKAQFRFVGTLVGLVIACGVEYYLKFNPSHLPVVAVIIAFVAGFMATKSYRYFIIVITLCVCLGFGYMNMPYTSLTPVLFLVDRAMGVFAGVLIFFAMQQFVFGTSNSKLELVEESYTTLDKLQKTLQEYLGNPSIVTAYKCAGDVVANSKDLNSYIGTAPLVFGADGNQALCYAKQVATLNRRALHLLVDEPTIVRSRMAQLLNVVTLKLSRGQPEITV